MPKTFNMEFPELLPEELVIEILSCLPVKSLVRFRCVSKSWNSLISDSQFVKLHLHRTISRSTDFVHTRLLIKCLTDDLNSLLERHSATVGSQRFLSDYDFIGTCNGLISLRKLKYYDKSKREYFSRFNIWNPATRTMSQHLPPLYPEKNCIFGFGYDCSSDTFKVVGVTMIPETMVNVYNMGDNCWRTIQVSPLPRMFLRGPAVYVSNTLNWLANLDIVYKNNTDIEIWDTDPFLIVSFDLGKENYAQELSLPYCPRCRDGIHEFFPTLGVSRGCLCVSQHDRETGNLIVWQMKEFGVHKSWTQLLNITADANILPWPCFAACMSENGDAILYTWFGGGQAVLYNRRDNKLEDKKIANNMAGFTFNVLNYIETLVSPC